MPSTQKRPDSNAGANPKKNHTAAGTTTTTSLPTAEVIRISAHEETRLVLIKCPYCGLRHTHGLPYDRGITTTRVSHCAPPAGTWHRRKRLEHQLGQHQQVIDQLIENLSNGDLTIEQFSPRIKALIERRNISAEKLQAITDRYPRGKSYTIDLGDPAGPNTPKAGPAK